jgi:hypothetical protein
MAKQTGLAWTRLDVDDSSSTAQDLRGDVTNFNFATPRGVQDVTGIDKSAMERLLLLADFSISLNGVFNDATSDSVHDVFANHGAGSGDYGSRTTGITVSGQTLDVEVLYTDYALTRAANGALTFTVPGVLADGTVPTWAS